MKQDSLTILISSRREEWIGQSLFFEGIIGEERKKDMNPQIQEVQWIPTGQISGDLHLDPLSWTVTVEPPKTYP
jgi:hypothetical protein